MKIIELLNKIANGEEVPSKIKIGCSYLTLNDNKDNYIYEDSDEYYGDELIHWYNLDTKVEIIEEDKKIEKLELCNFNSNNLEMLIEILNDLNKEYVNKINEIIDKLNSMEE